MTIVEFIRAFAHDLPVAVVVTNQTLEPPGPTILYANPAFGELTGRDHATVVGLTPRFMQGRETRRATLDAFHQALAASQPFHGFLSNYRPDGTRYRVEIDCRPLLGMDGTAENFIAFEREVVRRLGRPASGKAGRYVPANVSNELLGSVVA
jgi:PAS domain S-box-containing protein